MVNVGGVKGRREVMKAGIRTVSTTTVPRRLLYYSNVANQKY